MKSVVMATKKYSIDDTLSVEMDSFLANEDVMYYTSSYVLAQKELIVQEIAVHRTKYAQLSPKKTVRKLIKTLPNNVNSLILAELFQFILLEWEKNREITLVSVDQ